jgi:hypothetical protein
MPRSRRSISPTMSGWVVVMEGPRLRLVRRECTRGRAPREVFSEERQHPLPGVVRRRQAMLRYPFASDSVRMRPLWPVC